MNVPLKVGKNYSFVDVELRFDPFLLLKIHFTIIYLVDIEGI